MFCSIMRILPWTRAMKNLNLFLSRFCIYCNKNSWFDIHISLHGSATLHVRINLYCKFKKMFFCFIYK